MAGSAPRRGLQPRQLIGGLLGLLRALAALTTAELKANVGSLRAPLAMLAAAAALLLTALTLALVAAVLALAELVGPIAAAAIVALVAGGAGLALGWNALSRLQRINLAPQRSIATLGAQIDRFAGLAKNADEAAKDQQHD